MKRPLLLLSAILLLVIAATPQSAAQTTPSGGIPVHAEATVPQSGAPQVLSRENDREQVVGAGVQAPSGAPLPSGGIGDPASYFKATPQPRIADGIPGEATWWNSWGPGIYAAIRPDLGHKGQLAVVCGGQPFHCITVQITTTCACLGPKSDRLIDLSLDAFRSFADPSVGVVRITLQVVGP